MARLLPMASTMESTMLRNRTLLMITMAAMCLAVTEQRAWAIGYTKGDVFASVNSGLVDEFSPTGTLIQTLNTTVGGFTTGSVFDSSGNFYVTDFSTNQVSKFGPTGTLIGTFGSGFNTPESIIIDSSGNTFVGNVSGPGITEYNSAGTLIKTFPIGRTDWFDLNASETTAFYTTEGTTINEWNLTTNTAGPTFASGLPGTDAFALRILGDGSILVADSAVIEHLSAAGTLIRTYSVAGNFNWFSLNLDPDGTTFWSGDFNTGNVCRFNIATGAVVNCFNTSVGGGNLFGLSLFGEITQVNNGAVPEPATMALLGTGLVAVGARYRRRRTKA